MDSISFSEPSHTATQSHSGDSGNARRPRPGNAGRGIRGLQPPILRPAFDSVVRPCILPELSGDSRVQAPMAPRTGGAPYQRSGFSEPDPPPQHLKIQRREDRRAIILKAGNPGGGGVPADRGFFFRNRHPSRAVAFRFPRLSIAARGH